MTDEWQDIVARAEALLAGIDLGNEGTFSGAVWWDGEANYMDGNTPNQDFADAAPELVRALADEVKQLRYNALPHAVFGITQGTITGLDPSGLPIYMQPDDRPVVWYRGADGSIRLKYDDESEGGDE